MQSPQPSSSKPTVVSPSLASTGLCVGNASQPGGKTGSELIEAAFGGVARLWLPYGRKHRGTSTYRMALKRLSRMIPRDRADMSPSERLRFWGFQENATTQGLFFVAKAHRDGDRIITANLARKWLLHVHEMGRQASNKPQGVAIAGEDLTEHSPHGEFQGVSLRYLPTLESFGNFAELPWDESLEKQLCYRNQEAIDEWLSGNPIPENHTRLFHGTNLSSMISIISEGVLTFRFQPIGDFGSGFYCTDKSLSSLRFSMRSALDPGKNRVALMYFDIDNDDLKKMKTLSLGRGDEWVAFTGHCLRGHENKAYTGERSDLDLVMGLLVHNPDRVEESDDAMAEMFDDGRMQYAFLEKNGNMLLKDKKKMGAALFDIYIPEFDFLM